MAFNMIYMPGFQDGTPAKIRECFQSSDNVRIVRELKFDPPVATVGYALCIYGNHDLAFIGN